MIRMLLRRSAIALVFAALAGGYWAHRVYWDAPSEPVYFAYSDVYRHALPTATFLHDELRRGNLPLWNPYQMAGQPFVALYVSAALYPPNLLALALLPPARALEALTLFHLALAGFFTWLFTARIGLAPPARMAAAIGFMFSAPMLHGAYVVPCLAMQAWLPAILWALHGLAAEARGRWAVALALVIALAFLAGYAFGFYLGLLLATAYGLFGLACVARRGTRLRVVVLAVAGAGLVLGLCAPQLLPTLELTAVSVRRFENLSFEQAVEGPLLPRTLVVGLTGWLPADAKPMQRIATLPILALPLALCGALSRRLRAHWLFLSGAALVSGAYLVGPATPVFGLFYSLPFGRTFRGPWQMLFTFQFLFALLAGVGVAAIGERLRGGAHPLRASRLLPSALSVLLFAGAYVHSALRVPPPAIAPPPARAQEEVVAFLRAAGYGGRALLQEIGFPGPLDPKVGTARRVFVLPDYESNVPGVYQHFFLGRAESLWHSQLIFMNPISQRLPPVPLVRSLDLASVRWYATSDPAPPGTAEAVGRIAAPIRRGEGYTIFERPQALPRSYVVEAIVPAQDFEAALALVRREDFRPREQAVVSLDSGPLPELPAAASGPATGAAEITAYASERVEVRARCERACLLVLTDLHYPGWRAAVDGRESPILRTNAIFRGVALAPGSHRVVFDYRPEAFRRGLVLLCAALALAVAAAFAARVRGARA